jgi:hypothetical protein
MSARRYVPGLAFALAATLTATPALAADIDGKWKTTIDAGPQGSVELVFDLKADRKKLTGTLSGPILPTPAPITDGLIDGDAVSFSLTMSLMPGMPPVLIGYSGTIKGDELSLAASLDMGAGHTVVPVVATRVR